MSAINNSILICYLCCGKQKTIRSFVPTLINAVTFSI